MSSLVSYLVLIKLKKDVKNNNDISVSTRRLGFILIFFLVFANIFTASSGFLLIAKKKKLEYIFMFEAFLINISIIFVSGVNLFKEIIPDNFYFGIIILILTSLFYIASMYLVSVKELKPNRKLFCFISAVLILTIFLGNILHF